MKGGFAPNGLGSELHMSQEERAAVLSDIEAVDAEIALARQQGNFQNLLACLERGLFLRRRLYAEASEPVGQACKQLCEVYNYCATQMLQQGNLRAAQDLLKRAEQVAERSDVDRAITLNNLACFYRRTGKLRTALTFLERALDIEERRPEADTSQTHLNLCATLSQLRRHDRALYHAQCALIRMYEILSPAMHNGELKGDLGTEARERMSVLCIAYHNLAVEHEYLKNYQSALSAYREGIRWAKDFLGEDHQIHQILEYSYNAVMKAQQGKFSENEQRKAKRAGHGQQAPPGMPSGARVGGGGAPGPQGPQSMEVSSHLQDLLTPRNAQAVNEADGAEAGPGTPGVGLSGTPGIPGKKQPGLDKTVSDSYQSDFHASDASLSDSGAA